MENRRSWPKEASCATSLVQGAEVVSNTDTEASAPEWQLPVQSIGTNHSLNCSRFPPPCHFKQAFFTHNAEQIQVFFCLEWFESTEIIKDFWELLLCIIFFQVGAKIWICP